MPRTECDGCVLLTLPCLPPSKMDAGGYIESTEFQTVLLSVSPLPSRRRTYRWLTFLLFLRLCTPFSLQEARLDVHVASSFFFSMVFTVSTFRRMFPPPPHPPTTATTPPFIAGSEFAVWLKGFKLGARCGQKFKHRVSNLEQDMPRLKKHGQLEQDAESMRTSKVATTRDTWRCPGQDSALTWKTRAICRNEVASGAA
jgi:hypothetical protein